MNSFLRVTFAATLAVFLSSCSDGTFGEAQVRFLINQGAKQLDSEQVILGPDQLQCGVREELWTIEKFGEDRSIGRLSDKARALNFSDDIQIDNQNPPIAQVRGSFAVLANAVQSIKDVDPTTKVVDARVAVVVNHSCFPTPLPLMGVRRGQFTADAGTRIQFRMNGDWQFDRFLH